MTTECLCGITRSTCTYHRDTIIDWNAAHTIIKSFVVQYLHNEYIAIDKWGKVDVSRTGQIICTRFILDCRGMKTSGEAMNILLNAVVEAIKRIGGFTGVIE